MGFREWWYKKNLMIKGIVIGLTVGLIPIIFTWYKIQKGECWLCLVLWFPILDILDSIFIQSLPNLIAKIIQLLFMLIQWAVIGLLIGTLFFFIKKILKSFNKK